MLVIKDAVPVWGGNVGLTATVFNRSPGPRPYITPWVVIPNNGADAVVTSVGVLYEGGTQTFEIVATKAGKQTKPHVNAEYKTENLDRRVRLTITPSLDPADYVFDHRIRVRFAETDAMGFLHHSNYFTYFEMGRTELFRAQVARTPDALALVTPDDDAEPLGLALPLPLRVAVVAVGGHAELRDGLSAGRVAHLGIAAEVADDHALVQ